MRWRPIGELFKETYFQWDADKAPRLGAALAYYMIMSLAPLLIIVVAIVGLALGSKAAQGQIVGEIHGLIGEKAAETVQMLIQNAHKPASGVLATLAGLVMLLFGASGVFGELKDALNSIWRVPNPGGFSVLRMMRQRFFLFAAVLGTGFLLLLSMLVTAGITALGKYLGYLLPASGYLLQLLNFGVSFAVTTAMFAVIYKVLPDTYVGWRDVGIGATFASFLFTMGKSLIGLYLGRSTVASVYGAAGSIIMILVWVYYSAQIFYMGAEFSQVYARRYGSRCHVAARKAA